jgi:hypothetical protein
LQEYNYAMQCNLRVNYLIKEFCPTLFSEIQPNALFCVQNYIFAKSEYYKPTHIKRNVTMENSLG